MLTPKEKQEFKEKQQKTFRASKLMQPNTTYMRLKYLFYLVVNDDSGWGKNKTYCLFKDEHGNILRTRKIKTLSYCQTPEYKENSIEEMLKSNRKLKHHLACGKQYHIVTSTDGSALEVHGNGFVVIRKGSKITAIKTE